jgi:alkyl sulfatase BDS1-like metallo-beta-lactamase superfamily hydrolase
MKEEQSNDTGIVSDFLLADHEALCVAEGVHLVSGQGNSVLVETESGLILTDSGPGGKVTRAMVEQVRSISEKPLLAIVYSHGHVGYNHGMHYWLEDAERRGDPAPQRIAQARLARRYRRYQETWGLQAHLNGIQFNARMPEQPPERWFTFPTVEFDERHVIDGGDRRVEVLAAPSETDDAMALWIPDCKVLYAGPAFIKSIPNIGTPLRTLRDPVRWADTMERLMALEPEVLIPEFGRPVEGRDEVRQAMQLTVDALRYLRRETVRRMNQGMTEWQILHDMEYPDEIFGHRLMRPSYGMPEYIVRDIWRSENGWWDRNPTHLHPAAPGEVSEALREAVADSDHVLRCAQAHRDNKRPQLALHVLDMLSPENPGDDCARRARALKAELLEQLAEASPSFVSAQIYRSEAARLAGDF